MVAVQLDQGREEVLDQLAERKAPNPPTLHDECLRTISISGHCPRTSLRTGRRRPFTWRRK